MKKRMAVISTCLAAAMLLTGCSWSGFAAKFTGADTPDSLPPALEQAGSGGDYVAEDCVKLAEYKGIEVDCKVSEDEVEAQIRLELEDHATVNKIKDRECKLGDTVNIDFAGKVDKKEFDGGTASDQTITLGSSGYISGFDDGVAGMKPGEKKDLKLKFPDDYHVEELKGKDVVFSVTLNYIEEKVVPELTEEYVTSNTEQKTLEEYRENIRQNLSQEKKEKATEKAYTQVAEKSEVIKYPETLVNQYTEQMDFYQRNMAPSQYGYEDFNQLLKEGYRMTEEQYKQKLEEVAKSDTKTRLITEAIAAREGITVTDEEIKDQISSMLTQPGQDEAALRKNFEETYGTTMTLEEYFRLMIITNKAIDFISDNVKIVE